MNAKIMYLSFIAGSAPSPQAARAKLMLIFPLLKPFDLLVARIYLYLSPAHCAFDPHFRLEKYRYRGQQGNLDLPLF
jgi:hypothetical protein